MRRAATNSERKECNNRLLKPIYKDRLSLAIPDIACNPPCYPFFFCVTTPSERFQQWVGRKGIEGDQTLFWCDLCRFYTQTVRKQIQEEESTRASLCYSGTNCLWQMDSLPPRTKSVARTPLEDRMNRYPNQRNDSMYRAKSQKVGTDDAICQWLTGSSLNTLFSRLYFHLYLYSCENFSCSQNIS